MQNEHLSRTPIFAVFASPSLLRRLCFVVIVVTVEVDNRRWGGGGRMSKRLIPQSAGLGGFVGFAGFVFDR